MGHSDAANVEYLLNLSKGTEASQETRGIATCDKVLFLNFWYKLKKRIFMYVYVYACVSN